jgi:hypothetical protein
MRFFFRDNGDNFVLIPTIVIMLGRCEGCGKVGGMDILFSWLNAEAGVEIDFKHHD